MSASVRVSLLGALLVLAACQHTVQIEAPKEPIVINLNVKIEQEVRVKVEEDVEQLIDTNEDIF
ncbi:MAG: YnbE family lipoprotein [Geminicoccaceae bacterium]